LRSSPSGDDVAPTIEAANRSSRATVTADDADEENNAPVIDNVDGNLSRASRRVWGMPSLRPHQSMAIKKILFNHNCDGKLLLVARTGGERRTFCG